MVKPELPEAEHINGRGPVAGLSGAEARISASNSWMGVTLDVSLVLEAQVTNTAKGSIFPSSPSLADGLLPVPCHSYYSYPCNSYL